MNALDLLFVVQLHKARDTFRALSLSLEVQEVLDGKIVGTIESLRMVHEIDPRRRRIDLARRFVKRAIEKRLGLPELTLLQTACADWLEQPVQVEKEITR